MGTSCLKKSSGATILARVEVADSLNDAASIQAAFDGVNRDEYF